MKTKIIIAGSRDFNNYSIARKYFVDLLERIMLDFNISITELEIVSGCAQGADRIGERLANEFKIKVHKMPAQWDLFGKRAGYVRNEEMAKYAMTDAKGFLLAFHDGESRGTNHMIDLADKLNLIPFVILYKNIK